MEIQNGADNGVAFHPIITNEPEPANPSGIIPTEFKVLILPDEGETAQRARRSNILLPDSARDRDQHAQVSGRIVDQSPAAFSYHEWPENARIPRRGDRVYFGKYAGTLVTGKDGAEYKLVNDKDVAAIIDF